MPVPRIFKRFTRKTTSKASADVTTAPNVPANHEKDASSKTLVAPVVVPAFPDNLKEAWAAANKELPQARGAEKFLNRVGTSIADGSIWTFGLK